MSRLRDRGAVGTSISLLLIAAVAWVDVIRSSLGASDMMMTMFMPMTMADGLAFVASWGVMMTAMMLPSALPMIGLYGATQRGEAATAPRGFADRGVYARCTSRRGRLPGSPCTSPTPS